MVRSGAMRALAAVFAINASGCVETGASPAPLEAGTARLQLVAARESPPCVRVSLVTDAQGRSARLTLVCNGASETFDLLPPDPNGAAGDARFFQVRTPPDGVPRDRSRVVRLLDRAFTVDPWRPRQGTFAASNAIHRGPEGVIVLLIAASMLFGFGYVVRARPGDAGDA